MDTNTLKTLFETHKEETLSGRYIHAEHIKPLLIKHKNNFTIEPIGHSVLGEAIHSISIGNGPKRILMWSQMHGNESTTTKAIFDLLNLFNESNALTLAILKACTIAIIPLLNPDGAKAYTRLNANAIDLNRDAKDLSQPESRVLRDFFNAFKPHFCFNLHGQRTIFGAGKTNNSATISFLSPTQDQARNVTDNRQVAMSLINDMNSMLQLEIPNQVGIYDDAYNINCVGDTFQTLNVPTILFEAGHYKNDYNREEVRRFMFQSLLRAIQLVASNEINTNSYSEYSKIPQNEKCFYDIIIKDAKYNNEIVDIAIQYQERLVDNIVHFIPQIEKIEKLKGFYAHKTLKANYNEVLTLNGQQLVLGNEIDFVNISNVKFSLNIE
ncbi:M14 family zinc carboxypeptidase [Lacinutrix sp. Hel_I_90]|uniref:M14 family zinc carboxypeptidase n=1 Tax=Lacinutrix sp. Hel_I_90 TaxID=1249999 RepID=UPI0005CA08DD|nr:M14 family zinc carboxypeptidase [Lacinutrix sp. Hel_I_90]